MRMYPLTRPLLLAVTLAHAPSALACSTCKCGDPTLTLMGLEKPYAGRLRAGIDYLNRSESQGAPGRDRARTDEQRLQFSLAWSPDRAWTLAAQLPLVRKTLAADNLARAEAEGVGDVDLVLRHVNWQDRASLPRQMAGFIAGLRLPTAEQVRAADGRLVDIDAQPDAGAWAPNLGLWYGQYRFPWFFSASARYFVFGDGRQGFEPGNALVASLRGQYALDTRWALQFGVDARQSGRNAFSGVEDPDSGGVLAMGYAGAALRLFGELLVDAGVQLPLLDGLHGQQDEDAALRLGLTVDF